MAKHTTQTIIEQFTATHGNRYNYKLVDFQHSQEKVKIICKKHGIFLQLVGAHRRGQGCAKCMYDTKRLTQDSVLEKFKKTHKDLYDYSLVEYKNIDEKVNIICKTHGVFKQSPYHHIYNKTGCPKCIGRHKSRDQILKEFKEIHGNKYTYSNFEYQTLQEKIDILCEEHGVFFQAIGKHLAGQGCPKCASGYKLTTKDILKKFFKKHSYLYDYGKVHYINSITPVEIICSEHGSFFQLARLHASGTGCPKCAGNQKLTKPEVIKKFKSIHGEKYIYDEVNYVNAFTKVKIKCQKHSYFLQTPHAHKSGSGCQKCAFTIKYTKNSNIECCDKYDGRSILYIVKCFNDFETFYKVGISHVGALKRFNCKHKMPYQIKLLYEVKGKAEDIWDLEKKVHSALNSNVYIPLLKFSGYTECFSQLPKMELTDNFDTWLLNL